MIPQVHAVDIFENFGPAKSFGTVSSFVNLFIPLMMTAAAILTLFMFLWGGYTYLTAGGEKENVAKAQKIFSYTIIGLIIIVSSFLFVRLIGRIMGINIL